KIVSGGQTGVDRAALDVALKHGIECGGWCPAGRLDEFGRIPDQYPVQELQAGGFTERTLQNVKDSNGTVVIFSGKLGGGTEQTVRFCVELRRPHQLIDASKFSEIGLYRTLRIRMEPSSFSPANLAAALSKLFAFALSYDGRTS